ncbi:PREDICTED: uncharacterized protein LOC109174428 [Ipomoea nil]|uniref:uncharacterized protein LOC109174428 n=1 Tax=Ipomoea nil TaxID=35883 RepID=UPI000901D086|nr:PREDICTED: uncharacterized protein LOC109174428 [Ipomoea nil]
MEIILSECFSCCKECGVLPPNLDLRSISSLKLKCSTCCFEVFVDELTRVGHAHALNVELLSLDISNSDFTKYIKNSAFIHLLRSCPKLCELDISLKSLKLNPEDFVLMEDLSSVARTLKMLCTLKFCRLKGLESEMQSIKVFLACFLGIEEVIDHSSTLDSLG